MSILARLFGWLLGSDRRDDALNTLERNLACPSVKLISAKPPTVFTVESIRMSIDRWLMTDDAHEIRRAFTLMGVAGDELTPFLIQYEHQLEVSTASGESLTWWHALVAAYTEEMLELVCVAEAIAKRRLTVTRFFTYLAADSPCDFAKGLARVDVDVKSAQVALELPRHVSDSRGWTSDEIASQIDHVKVQLGWGNTTGSARTWWETFENENQHQLALVLRLVDELAFRKATITDFFFSYVYSNTDNIQANLHYLDYTRIKKEVEYQNKAAPAGRTVPRVVSLRPDMSQKTARTNGAGDEALRAKLNEALKELDWSNLTKSTRALWEEYENRNQHRLAQVLSLAEELAARKATINEFFLVCIKSNTDDFQANLHYLDYSRLKEEEARQKKTAAYAENRQKLGVDSAPDIFRQWWVAQEQRYEHDLHVLYDAAHELVKMNASIQECMTLSAPGEPESLLTVVERMKIKRNEEQAGSS